MEAKLQQRFNELEITPSASLWQRIESELPEGEMEQKIRAQLNDAELKQTNRLWDKISSELPGANEGPTFRYWGLTTVLGVFLVAAIGYVFTVNQQNQKVATTLKNEQQAKNTEASQKHVSDNSAQENIAKDNNKSSSAINQSLSTNHGTSASAVAKPSVSSQSDQEISARPVNRSTAATARKQIYSSIATTPASQVNELKPRETIASHSLLPKALVDAPEQNVAAASRIEQNTDSGSTKQLIPIVLEPEIKSSAESNALEIGKDPGQALTVVSDSAIQQAPVPASVLTGNEELTPFSLTATAGVNYSMMRLALPSTTQQYPLAENKALRESLEKPSVDFAFSFLVDYKLNERIRISAGIGRVIFSQSFSYNVAKPMVGPTTTESIANMTFASDSIVQGDAYNQIIRYTWTELPLLVTWSFKSKSRWQLGVQAGLSYALLSTVQANMVNYDNVGILVLNEKSSFPGFQNHVFALLNPTLAYSWKPDVEFLLQPTIRYAMNSMVENSNWVQQYPVLLGINVAMRKRF
ncbi:MAG: outer membrane beta-barrel protein [Bacteroidota bacterium]